jgi:hypothetical protein
MEDGAQGGQLSSEQPPPGGWTATRLSRGGNWNIL